MPMTGFVLIEKKINIQADIISSCEVGLAPERGT
jgi:hypothetical protein